MNKHYIGLYSINDHPDCGGGLQEPFTLQAPSLEEAKKEATNFIKDYLKRYGVADKKYPIGAFTLYEVTNTVVIDTDAITDEFRRDIENAAQKKAQEKEISQMLKLMQKYPKEAEQIVVDNQVGENNAK